MTLRPLWPADACRPIFHKNTGSPVAEITVAIDGGAM